MFFLAWFLGSLFLIFSRFYAKKGDFGTPLRASWAQNGTQNQPNGAKMLKKSSLGTPLGLFSRRWPRLFANLHGKRATNATQGVPKMIFYGFCMDLALFFVILDTSTCFFKDCVKVSVSFFALFSQVAKNGQEPAKNQAHNELLKT